MSRKTRRWALFVFVAIGLILLNYPLIAIVINDAFAIRNNATLTVSGEEGADIEKIVAMRAYNAELLKGNPHPENVQVLDLLEPGALLGYLEVPTINVYMAVRYGTTTEVLEKDLGLLEGSSLPAGGKGSHAAISGHTGMASKKMLTDLTAMVEGDIFFFHTFGLNLAYQVDNIAVVLPSENELLRIDPNEDYMTLITCTPYGVNSHRLLVRGKRIDYDFSKSPEEQGVGGRVTRRLSDVEKMRYLVALISLLLLILMLILTLRGLKKDKERDARKARKAAAAAKAKLKRKDEHNEKDSK